MNEKKSCNLFFKSGHVDDFLKCHHVQETTKNEPITQPKIKVNDNIGNSEQIKK